MDLDEVLAATFTMVARHLTERQRRLVIVEPIRATTSHRGLPVRAELDPGRYPLGVRVGDEELATVPLVRHEFHGEWNYSLHPAA